MKKFKNYTQGIGLVSAILFMANPSFAAVTDTNQSGGMSNTSIFYILCLLAIIILVGIFFLTNSVKDLMQSEFYKKKIYEQEEKKRSGNKTIISTLLVLIGVPFASNAMSVAAPEAAANANDFPLTWVWMMVIVNLILLGVVFYVRNLFYQILRSVKPKKVVVKDGVEVEVKETNKITQLLTDAVPIEKEHEIMMDHEYDGIHELDNNMPPWWLWSFYASIVFAVIYLFNYHIIESSPLQLEEYNISMEEGDKAVAEYLVSQKLNVDENSVVVMTEPTDISAGKGIFDKKCVVCHGAKGEGVIGPNLTDEFWLHGGDIQSIFKIVKYGVVEKGMQAWDGELNPVEMQQVSSYIKSIKGLAIGEGKEPQGDKFVEGSEADEVAMDSTAVAGL